MSAKYFAVATMFTFCLVLAPAFAAEVDFETLAVGSTFNMANGQNPGDTFLVQNGIAVTVEEFTSGVFTGFNALTIDDPTTSFFPASENMTQSATTNNINMRFDFTGLGFGVTRASIEFADGGDTNNFDLNDTGQQEFNRFTQVTPVAGYTISVNMADINGTDVGTLEVIADPGNTIQSIEFGGQETSFDNLVAIPEPTSVTCLLVAGGILMFRRTRS
mgnify:CR=1 FL=1